jgi:predicted dehydrogenase
VKIANRSRYFFIEKPVFDELDIALTTIPFAKDAVCYVAAPLRHCGVLKKLREIVSPHEVYCARAICSSYLPDWRPNVDYRTIYSASKEAGGGVRIDLIHEWDYLSDLFGFPNEIYQLSGRFSDLEITSEDLAVYIGKYDDKLVEVHLDYFGRETRRSIELFTKKRTIYGDIANARITFSDGTPAIECEEERNVMYMREMQYFMSLVLEQTDHSMNDIEHAMHVMRLALSKESKNT